MSVCQTNHTCQPSHIPRDCPAKICRSVIYHVLCNHAQRERKSDTILTLPYPFCGDLVNPHPFIPEFYNHNPSVVLQGIPRVEISHRNQLEIMGNNQRKVEISTVRAPLFFSVNNYSSDPAAARAHARSGRLAHHRETEKSTGNQFGYQKISCGMVK